MTKLDKTRPDLIKLHKVSPDLAKKIIEYDTSMKKLRDEMKAIEHKMDLQDAYKTVIFDEIKKRHGEDIKIISPEESLKYEVDGEEVYLLKGELEDECPGCGNVHPPVFELLKILSEKVKKDGGRITGLDIGTMNDMPEDVREFFRRRGFK